MAQESRNGNGRIPAPQSQGLPTPAWARGSDTPQARLAAWETAQGPGLRGLGLREALALTVFALGPHSACPPQTAALSPGVKKSPDPQPIAAPRSAPRSGIPESSSCHSAVQPRNR